MKNIAIGVVGLLLVAMLALFFWARAILGTEAVRAALASQISQALGQPVVIGGLSAMIYPHVGITLKDVTVGSASPITVRTLAIEADLRALLSRRIEHASLRLDGARIVLPLPPLTLGAVTHGRAPTTAAAPVELVSIDEVALRRIEIVSDGHVLRGDIEVVPRGAGLVVKSVALAAGAMTLRASGEITDLEGPVGELSLAAGALNFDEMLGLAEAFTMRVGIVMAADRATMGG